MSASLATRLQDAVRSLDVVERLMKGPMAGPGSLIEVAPGVVVKTLARSLADLNIRVEGLVGNGAVSPYKGSNEGRLQFKGLRGAGVVKVEDGGDAIVLSLDALLTYTRAQIDDAFATKDYADAAAAVGISDAAVKTKYENNDNTNAYTDAEKAKLAAIDAAHYGAPVQTIAALKALPQAQCTDKQRRFVEDEQSDYFYDATATVAAGYEAPNDQVGGVGFWRPAPSALDVAPAALKAAYESNPDTNAYTDAEQAKLAAILAVPAGTICAFAMNTPPTGWLKSNGALASRTTYANLFAAIGTAYGAGDGSTTFGLPDLRGEFWRGWDDGRGVDTGRAIGSAQEGTRHPYVYANATPVIVAPVNYSALHHDGVGANVSRGYTSTMTVSDTTPQYYLARPRNVALLACIKY